MTGRVLSRLGDLVEALSAYETYTAKYPGGAYVDAARFFSGFLLYEHRRYRQANEHFAKVRQGRWLSAAQWYGAWSSFLNGDYQLAALALERQATQPGVKWADKRRARYCSTRHWGPWAIAARAIAQEMLNESTLDWYGLLLLNRGLRLTAQREGNAEEGQPGEVGLAAAQVCREPLSGWSQKVFASGIAALCTAHESGRSERSSCGDSSERR